MPARKTTTGSGDLQGPRSGLERINRSSKEGLGRGTRGANRKAATTSKEATKGNKKVTSSADRSSRAKRSKAGNPTSSTGRANRSKVSKAKVTSSGGGTKGSAKVTSSGVHSNPGKGPGGSRATTNAAKGGKASGASGRMSRITKASSAARTSAKIKGIGAKGGAAAVAYETLKARPVADGTLKGKPNTKFGPAFDQPKKKSFDQAFKSARKSKLKTFNWQGKKYNTKLK